MNTIRISGIVGESIVDGPGLRYVIFTQGCTHNCKGCHNPQTHALDGGFAKPFGEILSEIDKNPLLDGVTFSGGEPFLQAKACAALAEEIKKRNLHIISYTGFLFEDLLKMGEEHPDIADFLTRCDILIDGPFIESQKSYLLKFKGSKNQRIIDIPRSFTEKGPVLCAL